MTNRNEDQARARPGRPRSEAARKAILSAAAEILDESGLARVTVEAVANRAGVGKPTIYRYWSNAQELSMAALMERGPPGAPKISGDGAPIEALKEQVASVVRRFSSKRGRQAAQLMASAEADSELAKAFRNRVILSSRDAGRTLLEQAMEEGALQPDIQIETALDLIYGPIFYRLLTGHAPLDEAFAADLVGLALRGLESR